MRVLLISDVHANREALAAVEAATGGQRDAALCLGDIVGYGAHPNEAVAWVRRHVSAAVRGNHDQACASGEGLRGFNDAAAAAARWTHRALAPEAIEWLSQLPAGPIEFHDCVLAHGSPLDEDAYVVSPVEARAVFRQTTARLQFFGHTHRQGGFRWNQGQVEHFAVAHRPGVAPAAAQELTLELAPDCRYLINPGSVGQPRDGDWRAAYLIYDTEAAALRFGRVPYEIAQAQEGILRAGLPAMLAARLARGV